MIIQLTQKIRIRRDDAHNYALERQVVTKSGPNAGKVNYTVVGHYGDLATAARTIPDRHLYLFEPEDQERVIDGFDDLARVIRETGQMVVDACRAVERRPVEVQRVDDQKSAGEKADCE